MGILLEMNLTADLQAPCAPDELFQWVADLALYPQWMGLVHTAVPVFAEPVEGFSTWDVELRARIGPFARSKRLTMQRIECDQNRAVVFERREQDSRLHSTWRLTARIHPESEGARLEMELHYGGAMWTGGLMERVLHDEIVRSRDRLVRLINDSKR